MPNDVYDYAFTLYPLQTGYCALPTFHIKFNHSDQDNTTSVELLYKDIDSVIQNMLAKNIFILPKDYKLLNDPTFKLPGVMPIEK